ncbi:nitrilase family protein [Capnocytophaga sp. ARDL2]|uniref:nitrilase family protein n=1 Tax=Capnocytophaga sp. ARDL2 TaxID=3238809 RepID=UPI0035571E76
MKIALVQYDTIWENKIENLKKIQLLLNGLNSKVDLIVLPEMCTTGFTMNPKNVAEIEKGETLSFLQNIAKEKQSAVVGSWVIEENGHFFNRLFFIFSEGNYQTYNKKHLFTLAGEQNSYSSGDEKIIINYKGWNICPLICYDLRFPVFTRIVDQNYDLLIYVASWPEKRIFAWDSLLKARAIENMSYTIAVNRCGIDNQQVNYSGHSQAIDYMGNYIVVPMHDEQIQIVEIDKDAQENARKKLAFLNDADKFELK